MIAERAMKIILAVAAVFAVVALVLADYRWRQWLAARREERERDGDQR